MKRLLTLLLLCSPISAHQTAPPRYTILEACPKVLSPVEKFPLLREIRQQGMLVQCDPGNPAPTTVRFLGDWWMRDIPITQATRLSPTLWRVSTPLTVIVNILPGQCAVSVRRGPVRSQRVGVVMP